MISRSFSAMLLAFVFVVGGCGGVSNKDEDGDAGTDVVDDATDTATEPGDDTIAPDVADDPADDLVPDVTEDGEDVPEETAEDAPDDSPGSGVVGDPCTGDGDCESTLGTDPYCLDSFRMGGRTVELPNGYCSADCTDDGGECGSDGICVRLGGTWRCLKACTADGDCRESEGYVCFELWSGDTACLPDFG